MFTSTILASILGLVGAALPRLLGWLEAKQKSKDLIEMQKHERDMFGLQTDRLEKASEMRMRELDAEYAGQANIAVYDFARPTTGWTAKLSESVRPVVTYILLALFVLKTGSTLLWTLGAVQTLGAGGLEAFKQAMGVVWDSETRDLFATVIVFWFGDRAMNRRSKGAA